MCKKCFIFAPHVINETMKKTKKQKETVENEVVPEEKKSKFTLYWEKRQRLGIPDGEILNRAVLR